MLKAKSVIILLSALFFTTTNFAEQPVFVKEMLGQIDFVKSRLMQLAEAMPEDKYSWTPGEEVRSVGEVYVHAAEANYYMVSLMKGEKVNMNPSDSEQDKKSTLSLMEKSFSDLKESVSQFTDEDLNREIEAFGMKFSIRNFMVTVVAHLHEHLGQSIAYARMNGITPPWSQSDSEG